MVSRTSKGPPRFIHGWRAFAGTARRTAGPAPSNVCAQGGNATSEFLVELIEIAEAIQLINRRPEPTENANEQKSQPELNAPSDGAGEHTCATRYNSPDHDAWRSN